MTAELVIDSYRDHLEFERKITLRRVIETCLRAVSVRKTLSSIDRCFQQFDNSSFRRLSPSTQLELIIYELSNFESRYIRYVLNVKINEAIYIRHYI